MTSINDLFGLTHPLRRVTPEPKIERPKSTAKPAPDKELAATSSSTDKVSISESGKNLLSKEVEVAKYLNQIQGLINLDEHSIQVIKERIEQGYYDGPAVVSQIIADLIAPPPYTDLIEDELTVEQKSSAQSTKLIEVQQKIEQGAYFQEEVTEVIADKLLETDYI